MLLSPFISGLSVCDLLSEMQTATRGDLLQEIIGKVKSKYQVQDVNYLNYTGLWVTGQLCEGQI